MRVTENMRFNATVNNFFKTQSQYNDIMEKIASQKKVNRTSDDPIAATKIIELGQTKAANGQYRANIDHCEAWIASTESNLSGAYDLLVSAKEIAMGQATGTANATTRNIAAKNVQALIDEMGSLANAKLGDRYLFSGSRDNVAPFSTTSMVAEIKAAGAAANNAFKGTVTSAGVYTGTVNKTYALKITNDGVLGAATYKFSADGGRTWNKDNPDLTMPAGGSITLGDGVTLTFNDAGGTKPFGDGDIFYVNAVAGGYYQGNDEAQSLTIGRGTSIDYNITGAEAFTAAGGNSVDIFKTLHDLKDALESNDAAGISGQLSKLEDARKQITLSQSLCGTKANHIEVAKSNLTELDEKLSSMLSTVQDADLAELATKLSMKELALKTSYAMAAKIGTTTILDFIR
jgi:flagellar hook-associated protein 3 FlgL